MSEKGKRGRAPRLFRQGDVIIIECESTPEIGGLVEQPREADGGLVVAWGEVTNHRHQFRDPGVCMLRAEGVHDAVLRVGADIVNLVHDEHAPIALSKGTYIARVQREYSPDEIRYVAD